MKNEILYESLHRKFQEMSDSTNEINGYIGLIRESDLTTEDHKRFKRAIEVCAFQLQNQINNSRDLLNIIAGQIKISTSQTNIHDLLGQGFIGTNRSDPKANGLIDSGDLAEQYAHWLRNFLLSLSHVFRTPNNAVMGFAELLSSSIDFPAEQQQNLKLLRDASERINQIVLNCLEPFRYPR